jgi:predicted dehydrogenase
MAGYAAAADVDLVALAGMEPDGLQRLGDKYDVPQQQRYADWQDLIDHGTLDVLSIAAPTILHAPIAMAALNAGVHVLSEKPMAENADKARLMVEAAEDQ